MTRRLKGRSLLDWHLNKHRSCTNIDPLDSQYRSDNLNPFVYSRLSNFIQEKAKRSQACSVVEFGARAGHLGKTLCEKHSGVAYLGFEPYPPKGRLFNIIPESCEEALDSGLSRALLRKADILVYADVLEHLNDPWAHLKSIYDIAKSGAVILVSIPNFFHHSSLSLLSDGEFVYEEWGVLDLTHLRFFGLKDIIQMLNVTGWVVDDTTITPAFDPEGLELLESFRRGDLSSWTDRKLTWSITSETDAIKLAAYQFIMSAQKLPEIN